MRNPQPEVQNMSNPLPQAYTLCCSMKSKQNVNLSIPNN